MPIKKVSWAICVLFRYKGIVKRQMARLLENRPWWPGVNIAGKGAAAGSRCLRQRGQRAAVSVMAHRMMAPSAFPHGVSWILQGCPDAALPTGALHLACYFAGSWPSCSLLNSVCHVHITRFIYSVTSGLGFGLLLLCG